MTWMRVETSRNPLEGQYLKLEPSALRLRVDVFDDRKIALDDISKLSISVGNQKDMGIKWGAPIGAAVGFGTMFYWSRTAYGVDVVPLLAGLGVGMVAGAAIGGFVGYGMQTWDPIWP